MGWHGAKPWCWVAARAAIRLDQAAFDQQMGADTFPLANYFALGFSPNISMVPEPAIAQLWLLGLLLLPAALRQRR